LPKLHNDIFGFFSFDCHCLAFHIAGQNYPKMWTTSRGGTPIQHIQPGKPRQNAYVERYKRTVRHEWLDQYIIESIEEAQRNATQWLWTCNNERPNISFGGITPAQKLKLAA